MPRKPTVLAFNPETMTLRDMKDAVQSLTHIIRAFETTEDIPEDERMEHIYLTALQYTRSYITWAKELEDD